MTILNENPHTGCYLVSEANNTLSYDEVTLVAGQNLQAGTVLAKITTGGKYKQLTPGASDGSQNAIAILYDNVNATAADTYVAVTARSAEVNGLDLIWPAGITLTQQNAAIAALAAVNIIVR